MPNTITEDELMEKARELGTVEAANKWMRDNGLTLVPNPIPAANGRQAAELPPVAQGGLSAVAAAEPKAEAGTSDFGSIDFAQAKRDPGAFYSNLMRMSQEADVRAAQASKALYEEGRKRILEKYAGPSQAERLYALSRAMLSPTDFPGFKGFLGNVVGALGETAKSSREAEQTREQKLFELQQQYQQGEIERAAARPKTALDMARLIATHNKPQQRRTGFNPVTGRLVYMDTDEPVKGGEADIPVLTPEQVRVLSRDPRKRGMRFRTTDGRTLEIK